MIDVITWVVFGVIAGIIAAILLRTAEMSGLLANVVVGLAGALIGGFTVRELSDVSTSSFNLSSLLVAMGGAILLLFIYNTLRGRV